MPASSTARKSAPGRDADGNDGQRGSQPPGRAGRSAMSVPVPVPRIRMPSGAAGNVLWWGGLAAVAAFGVVDWPVVAIVAAGTWVAEQQSRHVAEQQVQQGQRQRGAAA